MEDKPSLCELYQRLDPLRLIKSLITVARSMDLIRVYPSLKEFIIFLVGHPKYIESGIQDVLDEMYRHERKIWLYETFRRISRHIADKMPEVFGEDFLPASVPKFRGPVILALDKMVQM